MAGTPVALRARIRAAVVAREPVDAREENSIRRFVAHFDTLDDPLSQELDPVHVTGSGIVVGRRGIVLLRHKRLGIWLQPGGHVDPGETPWDAAQRETREETGLAVGFLDLLDGSGEGDTVGEPALLHVDVHEGGRGHTHLDLRYLLGGDDGDPDPPPGESQEVRWFGWDEASAIAEGGLRGLLDVLAVRSI